MINPQELVFVVDENNEPLEPRTRVIAHKNLMWHRTSGIWVLNSQRQVLCQKRSKLKDINPRKWEAFFGGHLAPGEDYLHNAIVETEQELGIKAGEKDFVPYGVFKSDKDTHKEFQQVFALVLENVPDNFNVEKEEVEELSWKTLDELRNVLVDTKDPDWVQKPWDGEVLEWLDALNF